MYGNPAASESTSDGGSIHQRLSRSDSFGSSAAHSPTSERASNASGYMPQYHGVSSRDNPVRTRLVWVGIEVPETTLTDDRGDSSMQFTAYPSYYSAPPNQASPGLFPQGYPPEAPMMQGQSSYGLQPHLGAFAPYPFSGPLQGYSQTPPPLFMQGNPSWHGHHPQAHGHQQNYAWRSGSNPVGPHGQGYPRHPPMPRQRSGHQILNAGAPKSHPSPHRINSSIPVRPPSSASSPHASSSASSSTFPIVAGTDQAGSQSAGTQTTSMPITEDSFGLIHDSVDDPIEVISESVTPLASDRGRFGAGVPLSDTTSDAPTIQNSTRGSKSASMVQQGPRSDHVLWCGNVPHDATVEELWEFFQQLPDSAGADDPDSTVGSVVADDAASSSASQPGHGVLSIFIISRSNCAFINYASEAHLQRALDFFHGKSLRPADPRCPKLVCRVRKKEDEAQAGVAGQRGRGVHVSWLNQQREAEKERRKKAALDAVNPSSPPAGASDETLRTPRKSPSSLSPNTMSSPDSASADRPGFLQAGSSGSYSSSGSVSFTSTNSSLFRHPAFRHRFFILKSLRRSDLEESVRTGLWATQPHNEAVLDQALRNSETVFLIFSVNESGEFFGYAKMASPIHARPDKTITDTRRTSVTSAAVQSAESTASGEMLGLEDKHASLHEETEAGVTVSSPVALRPLLSQPQVSSPAAISSQGEHIEGLAAGIEEGVITPKGSLLASQSQSWPVAVKQRTLTPKGGSRISDVIVADNDESSSLDDTKATPADADLEEQYGSRQPESSADPTGPFSNDDRSRGETGSLAPSDSISWTSSDSRFAEQIALRAVIHNLRLDERESRAQAHRLEDQLRATNSDEKSAARPNKEDTNLTSPRGDGWGKPFKIEWIKTNPLPFHRVRKLRNPWRDNRQVKVSRDGTELEPLVGRQLLEEWDSLSEADVGRKGKKRSSERPKNGNGGGSIVDEPDDEENEDE